MHRLSLEGKKEKLKEELAADAREKKLRRKMARVEETGHGLVLGVMWTQQIHMSSFQSVCFKATYVVTA